MDAGTYRIEFDVRDLAHGCYFIRLAASNSCTTRLLVIQ